MQERLLSAFMIVPETFCSVSDNFVVAESGPIVVQEREFIRWQYIRRWLSVEFCPDFREFSFQELSEKLIYASFAILSDVNSLSKGEVAVASYIFCVTTHVD
jgi:hypothetical protein